MLYKQALEVSKWCATGWGMMGVELDHVEPNRLASASTRGFPNVKVGKGYFLIIYIIFPYAPWDGDIYPYFPLNVAIFHLMHLGFD